MQILIVDDSPVMRKIIIKSLLQSGYADAELEEVSDGLEALNALERSQPKLILSDWNMPNMTGMELLCSIRGAGNSTPFGFLTTEFSDDMRSLALQNGATFLLSKPFNAAEIKAMIDPILRPML